MNRIIARGVNPNDIDFPSPVYSATIMGGCEDVVLGVGGGRRYGMPNAMVCVQITDKPLPAKEANAAGASDREKKKMAEYVAPTEGNLCWDVDMWLDLGDDQPWSSSGTFIASPPSSSSGGGAVSNSSITSNLVNTNSTYVVISHLAAYSVIRHHRSTGQSAASSPNNSFAFSKLGNSVGSGIGGGGDATVISRVARKALTENPNDPDKKCVCVSHINGAPITDAIIFAGQDDGSLCVSILVEKKQKNAATITFDTKSLVISAAELAMSAGDDSGKNAHISTLAVQTSIGKEDKNLVLMLVCDDKKVRYVLLPSPTDVHALVSRHGSTEEWKDAPPAPTPAATEAGATETTTTPKAPVPKGPTFNVATNATRSGLMKYLLVASAADLSLNFNITRSSLRMGFLFEGKGAAPSGHQGTVVSCLVAYDSAARTSVMSLSVLEVLREKSATSLRLTPLFESGAASDKKGGGGTTALPAKSDIVYGRTAITFPICSGAATNMSPVYPKLLSPSRRVLPPEFLVSTVEGELVLLCANFSGAGTSSSSSRFEMSGALSPSDFPPVAPTQPSNSSASSYLIVTGSTEVTPLTYGQSYACPAKHTRRPNSEKGWLHTEPISTMDVSSQSGLVVTADIAQRARLTLIDGGRRALEDRRTFLADSENNKPATLLIPALFDGTKPGLGWAVKLQLMFLLLIIVIPAVSLVLWDEDFFNRMLSPVAGQL